MPNAVRAALSRPPVIAAVDAAGNIKGWECLCEPVVTFPRHTVATNAGAPWGNPRRGYGRGLSKP